MAKTRVNPKPVLQADVNAIAPDCSSSLLISPTMFLQNMLFPGAFSVFMGSAQSDFTVDEKNLSVTSLNYPIIMLDQRLVMWKSFLEGI